MAGIAVSLVLSGCASGSLAAPTINDVKGSLIQSGMVTITGDKFQSADHSVLLKDDSDTSVLLHGGELVELSSQNIWQSKGSSWASPLEVSLLPPLNDDIKEYAYRGKGKTYNGYLSALENKGNDSIYVSWQYMPSVSPGHSGGSNKFIRIWDNHNGEDTRISWTAMHMTYSGTDKASWEGWSGSPGEWNHMELWVNAKENKIIASINGEVVHRINNFQKKDNGIGFNIKLLGFDSSESSKYADMVTLIDDLYVSTTRARIVLSDEDTWAKARNNGSVQVPYSWSDKKIAFRFDNSDFSFGDIQYLYIVNKDGVANEKGYELCGTCPAPPILTSN